MLGGSGEPHDLPVLSPHFSCRLQTFHQPFFLILPFFLLSVFPPFSCPFLWFPQISMSLRIPVHFILFPSLQALSLLLSFLAAFIFLTVAWKQVPHPASISSNQFMASSCSPSCLPLIHPPNCHYRNKLPVSSLSQFLLFPLCHYFFSPHNFRTHVNCYFFPCLILFFSHRFNFIFLLLFSCRLFIFFCPFPPD